MTCRAPDATTTCLGSSPTGAQLTYDAEGRLATWQNQPTAPTSSTLALYDGSGQRVQQAITQGAMTTDVTYVGGLLEVRQTAGTTTTTLSYSAGSQRVALGVTTCAPTCTAPVLSYVGADGLGSATVALDGAGSVAAAQLYGPYGAARYSSGTMPGTYGYTGQRADSTTGLDYYNARYYDPLIGQFTSADTVADGLNRYGYVGGNPTTRTDPTGHFFFVPILIAIGVGLAVGAIMEYASQVKENVDAGGWSFDAMRPRDLGKIALEATGLGAVGRARDAWVDPNVGLGDKLLATGVALASLPVIPGLGSAGKVGVKVGGAIAGKVGSKITSSAAGKVVAKVGGAVGRFFDDGARLACKLSFAAETAVATPEGERAIGTLAVGDQVVAYDDTTGASSVQTVEHVWVNHDDNLLDVTLRPDDQARPEAQVTTRPKPQQVATTAHGSQAPPAQDETIRTTDNHPWLTAERGWVMAGELHVGERVVRLDGTTAVVAALRLRPGVADYYNLTVSQVHTYAVGTGRYVVHNTCGGPGRWTQKGEGMPELSQRYQTQITGRERGWVYEVAGVAFDGFDDTRHVLLDAKARYAQFFLPNLEPQPFWLNSAKGGQRKMLSDARRQVGAAAGMRIEWHVMQAHAAAAIRGVLRRGGISGIEVIHTPLAP